MAAKLIIAPEADQDLAEAYGWYEKRRPGLGEDFLTCADARMQAICRMPEIYAVVHKNYRRSLIRRFPHAIFYEYVTDTVTDYGVFHTSRHPRKWRERLP